MRQRAMRAVAVLGAVLVTELSLVGPAKPQQARPETSGRGVPSAAQTTEESPNDLFVSVGKSVIVNSDQPIQRVAIGFGDIAEATAVGPQEVLVNGKGPGETSLIVWQQGGGKLFFDVKVQPSHFASDARIETLRRQLQRELPGQKIEASVENDLIFLRGSAKDLTSADRAISIASALGKAINLMYVDVPEPEAQILLKVRFASVDRSLSNQIGINIFSTGAANTIGGVTTQQFSPPAISGSTSSGGGGGGSGNGVSSNGVTVTLSNALNLLFFRPDINIGATIQALQTRGLLEVLAEPNVLAQNGKQASFLAGGEFPYPVVQGTSAGGTNAVTIQFRQFGVRLNFIPTITPRGTIRLQVAPEVSALDYPNGVTVSGFTIPGVSVRNVNTEVELSEGQSFAIGGLLDNRESENMSKIPFIGDIPILGKLFQSRARTKNNTELMVIVTPELVRPIPVGQPLPALNYPVPFLPPNTGKDMRTPGIQTTGPVPVKPPTPTIPVENLIKSFEERPLIINTTSGGLATGSSLGGSSASGAASAAPAAAAPAAPTAPAAR